MLTFLRHIFLHVLSLVVGISAFLRPMKLPTSHHNPSSTDFNVQHCKHQKPLQTNPSFSDSTFMTFTTKSFNRRRNSALDYSQNDDSLSSSSSSDNLIVQTSNTLVDMIQHRAFTVVNQQLRRERLALQNQEKKQREEMNRSKKNLELKWNIEKSNAEQEAGASTNHLSDPCETCLGKGKVLCAFCHGDGFVDFGKQEAGTIGGTMVSKNGGRTHVECPVCDENGEQCCMKCSGSGWIAKWNK